MKLIVIAGIWSIRMSVLGMLSAGNGMEEKLTHTTMVSVETQGDFVNLMTLKSTDGVVTLESGQTNMIKLEPGL